MISVRFAQRLARFLAAGVPAFAAALLTNFLLVDKLHWPKPVSYLIVLWLQTTINFFACRIFVFEPSPHLPFVRQYARFLSGSGVMRLIEWLFYTLFVEVLHVYYLTVQLASVVLFAVARFKFAESLFEQRKQQPANEQRMSETEERS